MWKKDMNWKKQKQLLKGCAGFSAALQNYNDVWLHADHTSKRKTKNPV